jgi:hypothetical protein
MKRQEPTCHALAGYRKEIRAGWWAEILPMIFNHRIIVTDGSTVDFAWCYETKERAIEYFEKWDGKGEPDGWHKNPMTGERRIVNDSRQNPLNEVTD